ncbi:MAG: hypothetical protein ABRQ26_06080 [Syntrophomonadaceae bacterium]
MEVSEKMDLQKFAGWLQDNLPGERRLVMNRVETVFPADILQPGSFAALLAYMNGDELMVCELASTFLTAEEAWAALSSEEVYTFRAVPFYQWAPNQYWTAKKVQTESFIS